MLTKVFFQLISFFVISNFIFAKPLTDPADALRKVTARMEQNSAVSYEITYTCKLLYSQSKEVIKAKVEMIRSATDQNFGCIFWYKISDTLEKYYDGKTIYSINHKQKLITTQDASKGDIDLVIQELDGDLIRIPFIAPKSISGLISKENKLKLTNYKAIKNSQCVNVKYPDDNRVKNAEMDLIFDHNTYDINRIISKMTYHSQNQTNDWYFRNLRYGGLTERVFIDRFNKFQGFYKKVKFQPPVHQMQNKQ